MHHNKIYFNFLSEENFLTFLSLRKEFNFFEFIYFYYMNYHTFLIPYGSLPITIELQLPELIYFKIDYIAMIIFYVFPFFHTSVYSRFCTPYKICFFYISLKSILKFNWNILLNQNLKFKFIIIYLRHDIAFDKILHF